jgi:alcohol dehydrogenase
MEKHFADLYLELLQSTSGLPGYPSLDEGVEGLARFVTRLGRSVGPCVRLSQCGVPADSASSLAEDAAKQWTGTFNPREVGEAELAELYRLAY